MIDSIISYIKPIKINGMHMQSRVALEDWRGPTRSSQGEQQETLRLLSTCYLLRMFVAFRLT